MIERGQRTVAVVLTRKIVVVFACGVTFACHRHPLPKAAPPNVERRLVDASPEERHVLRTKTRYWNWLDVLLFAAWPPSQHIGPTDLPVFPVLIDGAERRYGVAVIEHVFIPFGYGVRPLSRRTLLAWPLDRSIDEAFEAAIEQPGARIRHEPPAPIDRNIVLDLRPPPATIHFSPVGLSELDPMITKSVGRLATAGMVTVNPLATGDVCAFDAGAWGDRYSRGYPTTCARVEYEIAVSAEVAPSRLADTSQHERAAASSHLEIRRRTVPGIRLTHLCAGTNYVGINHPCMNWMSFWRDPDQYAPAAGFDVRAARIAPTNSLDEYEGPFIDIREGDGNVYTYQRLNAVARYEVRLAADGRPVARGLVDLGSNYDHEVASMVVGMKVGGRRLALASGNSYVPSLSRFTVVVVDVELMRPEAADPK